jgi:hypothetical protein
MTERISALLTELAGADAPPVPAADPIWRRAGRTRIRRRAALAAAAVALGAAAVALTTLSTQPIIGPAGPPADGGVGGLEPLPPRLTTPFGDVSTIARRPTDRVQLLVETRLFERRFFLPRTKLVCLAIGCGDHSVPLGVGSDHAYRHLIDPRRVSGQILLAPDGRYAAAVVSPLMYPGPPEEGGPTVEQEWVLIDLTTGGTLPSVPCTGSAGWTRDGWFVCIPTSGLPLTRYGIDSSGGLTGQEIGRASTSDNGSVEVTAELLGRNATALLGPAADPNAIMVTSVAAGPTETIFYPGAAEVRPQKWCGPDTVLVVADGDPSVIDLDGGVRSRFLPHPSRYGVLGCRPDGSMLVRVGGDLDKVALIRPDGSIAGEFSAGSGSSPNATHLVDVAVDAFEWEVGGSPAHGPGFRPLDWLDEALLVVVVLGGIGLLVVRGRRKRRMAAAEAELA